jgi:hypothetical protein
MSIFLTYAIVHPWTVVVKSAYTSLALMTMSDSHWLIYLANSAISLTRLLVVFVFQDSLNSILFLIEFFLVGIVALYACR